ncbi:TIGR02234 family membrane protein [Gordonia sp. CPCC 205333]|uniref:TIGR02234 family membrane protein n=1 Tax=Gordonia sp. CPCC 205333 TaxID=3140790 RepID=UPI003AF373CA
MSETAPTDDKTVVRRRQAVAAVALIAGAATLWAASRMVWATLTVTDDLSPVRAMDVHGSDWSPWLTPLALVLLAAIAAGAALRGWALRLVAILVALCGVLAASPAVSMLVGGDQDSYAAKAIDLAPQFRLLLVSTNGWAGVVVLVGAALAVIGGVLLLRVANGERMSSKYESPAARRAELEKKTFREYRERQQEQPSDAESSAPESERLLWDALDTGVDPTAEDQDSTDGK